VWPPAGSVTEVVRKSVPASSRKLTEMLACEPARLDSASPVTNLRDQGVLLVGVDLQNCSRGQRAR